MIKPIALAALALFALARPASADGYGDFNAGARAEQGTDPQAQIDALTRALADGDLPAHLRATAYLGRGRAHFRMKQSDAAIADFTQAIQADPGVPEAYLARCYTYSAKQMFTQALAVCTGAVQLQPQNWRLRKARVAIYLRMGKYDDAIADYSTFIAARPANAELLLERADAYRRAGNLDLALADAAAASDMYPHEAAPYMALGLIRFDQGDFAKSLDNFSSAIDRAPDDAGGYLAKGQVQWAMGDVQGASDSFKTSLKHNDLQLYAFLWLSISLARQGEKVPPDMTARFAASPAGKWPGPAVQLYLGKSAPDSILRSQNADADGDNEQVCSADFFVGEWYAIAGNVPEAKRLLQAAMATCPAQTGTQRLAAIDLARLN